MPPSKRDHLIETACDLFYRNGFHATGIDAILAEAGTAKMTLYRHFRSKEELILATLRLQDKRWRDSFVAGVEQRAKTPRGRLLAMFDTLEESFRGEGFCGCPFIKATSEYPSLADPIHRIAAAHQRAVVMYIRRTAADAGAPDPDALADQIALLLSGAIVAAQVAGDLRAARKAHAAAERLIQESLGKAP